MYWWGVSAHAVCRWRRALGVGLMDSEGTRRLRKLTAEKAAEATRGKPLSRKARKERSQRAKKLNLIQYARRAHPAKEWAEDEIALLGTMKDRDLAVTLGRPYGGVRRKRSQLGIPPFRIPKPAAPALSREEREVERRRKIAESRRGVPRPAHVVEAVRSANLGKKASDETRRKLSEDRRRRGVRPPKAGRPWTAEEDELLRTLPAGEVAKRTERSLSACYNRRHELELPDGRRAKGGRQVRK